METQVNYTAVGTFVLVFLVAMVITILWLSQGLGGDSYKTYIVNMDESVSGLSKDAPVKYNGVEVGSVTDIKLDLRTFRAIVYIHVDAEVPITTATRAVLTEQGIAGIAYINLRDGAGGALLKPPPGGKYPVIPTLPSFFSRLDLILEQLSGNLGRISSVIQDLTDKESMANFKRTMKNLNRITADFPILMQDIEIASGKFGKSSQATTRTMQNVTSEIIPPLHNTLRNLNTITNNLRPFTEDLGEDPASLIHGTAPPPLGPGER